MKKIGIFFGSDTGNTEKIAKKIYNIIGSNKSEIYDIANIKINKINEFDVLIFGIPTWYYGELQCDWDEFLPKLKKINLKNKIIALFGCGDQEDYSEYFCDAMGIIYNILKKKNVTLIGKWPIKGYNFESSKALFDKNNFVGLVIDEDRQQKQSDDRIKEWLKKIMIEIKNIII
ncbi:flavodoxin FldA [Buchnera aphidicola]|uniref:Flavodoxin n=1 Tax=Buchnera aphidicola (Therioaphis trifolii) TaxID=1241884 RepID=A0A4D6YKG0_9GAMM|nr:flavodoxin FldA [Buchnera aphidicola]QCI27201.1 flavodoxin FldA [Buchnera aphidicola (Therioaphis trifolii)]